MDDEHGDVGPVTSDVSEPTVSINVPNETLMENFERDNQIDESYNEGGGGEIIVEVVRSDVSVDGVSDLKEGDLESGEVGELRGMPDNRNEAATLDFREVTNTSTEGTENKVEEIEGEETAWSGPRHIAEKVEIKVGEFIDGGTCAVYGLRSPEHHEALSPVNEVMEKAAVMGREERVSKDEASDKDSANNATPEILDHPVEVSVAEEDVTVHKEEMLHLGYNVASDDTLVTDSVSSHEITDAAAGSEVAPIEASPNANCEVHNIVQFDGIDKNVGEIGLVHTASEPLVENTQMELSCNIFTSDHGTKFSGEDVLSTGTFVVGAVIDRLNEDSILKQDVLVSDSKDENLGLEAFDSMNSGTAHGNNSVPYK